MAEVDDPRVVEYMKALGIYHPALAYPPKSKQAREERETKAHILNQVQQEREFSAAQAAREQAREESLAQRGLYQQAMSEDRQARREATEAARRDRALAGMQYLMQNTPFLEERYGKEGAKAMQKQMSDAMLRNLGLEPPATTTTATTTAGKGEYGPGGVPAGGVPATAPPTSPPPVAPTRAAAPAAAFDYTTAQPGTAGGEEGTPEEPRLQPLPSARERLSREFATANTLAAGSGEMAPANVIPQLYGGTSTIPEGGKVGYYSSKGEFLAPLYTETGEKLPMPKGATGIRGTAGIQGLQRGAGGEITGPVPDYLKPVIAGRGGAGAANVPTKEAMVPTPAPAFTPPTEAFTGGTPTGGAEPLIRPGPFGVPTFPAFHPREWETRIEPGYFGVPKVVSTEKKRTPVAYNPY